MLLQIKRTLNDTINSLKNSVSSCLQFQLPTQIKKNMHAKLNNVKSGITTIQDQLKILMGSIHYIQAKNQAFTQQKMKNSKKFKGQESQIHFEKQIASLKTQVQMLKAKNQKLSKQIDFVKFSNHSLREQLKKISLYKNENQNIKTAMKGIQQQLMSNASKISCRISKMIQSSNLDYETQTNQQNTQNLCARQKISKFKNKKLTQFQENKKFDQIQFEIQDIFNLDITPPMEIVQATKKKNKRLYDDNQNIKRNNNLLREIYDLDNQFLSTKKKGKSCPKEKRHQHQGSKERKQQHNSVSKAISVKKSQELAKLVAEQTKIIQCKQRYLSTDMA